MSRVGRSPADLDILGRVVVSLPSSHRTNPLRADTDGDGSRPSARGREQSTAANVPPIPSPGSTIGGPPVNSSRSTLFVKHALEHGGDRGHRDNAPQRSRTRSGAPSRHLRPHITGIITRMPKPCHGSAPNRRWVGFAYTESCAISFGACRLNRTVKPLMQWLWVPAVPEAIYGVSRILPTFRRCRIRRWAAAASAKG